MGNLYYIVAKSEDLESLDFRFDESFDFSAYISEINDFFIGKMKIIILNYVFCHFGEQEQWRLC